MNQGAYTGKIFDIVNQLNASFDSPDKSPIDQLQLAELNITAGIEAKSAAAFRQAFKYFKTAIALSGQNAWAKYDRCLEMHIEAASSAYLCGDDAQLDLLVNQVLEHSRSPLDTAQAYEIKIRSLIVSNKLNEAIDTATAALLEMGVALPGPFSLRTLRVSFSVLWSSWRLSRRSDIELPHMHEEQDLAAMKLLSIMCHAAYIAGDPRISRYVLEMAYLSFAKVCHLSLLLLFLRWDRCLFPSLVQLSLAIGWVESHSTISARMSRHSIVGY